MRILLINHYAGSPELGMEFRPFYLGREWQRLGHEVQIVAASFSHLRQKQPPCSGPQRAEVREGIPYLWLRTPPYRGNGLGRVRNMLTFLLRLWMAAPSLAKTFRPQVVIASSTYPADVVPARRIAKAAQARLVFEVHDLWPLSPRLLGGMPSWHPFIVFMQLAEDYACRHSDRVISILPLAQPHLVDRGMAPDKFVHVPNGVDVNEWERSTHKPPPEHEQCLQRIRAEGKWVFLYAGAHGLANSLETLVQAASLLRSFPAQFVLVGEGPEKAGLQQQVAAQGLGNVTFLPPVPRGALPRLLAHADALVLCLRRSPLYRFGISLNKLFDYMMAGKPILYVVDAGNDPVQEVRCGITVEPENPQAVAAAVKRLMALPEEEREAMGLRGRAYAMQHHDYAVLAERFLEALNGR